MFVLLCHLHNNAFYTYKTLCHSKGLSQLMRVAHDRTHALALQTSRKKERKKAACALT